MGHRGAGDGDELAMRGSEPVHATALHAAGDLSLIHISEPHETVLDLVCRLLLEKKK